MNKIENAYDLQIIIAAYNTEQYIKDCLNSVCGQHSKYKTLVTVINDGSTDGTEHILAGITSADRGGSGAMHQSYKIRTTEGFRVPEMLLFLILKQSM